MAGFPLYLQYRGDIDCRALKPPTASARNGSAACRHEPRRVAIRHTLQNKSESAVIIATSATRRIANATGHMLIKHRQARAAEASPIPPGT